MHEQRPAGKARGQARNNNNKIQQLTKDALIGVGGKDKVGNVVVGEKQRAACHRTGAILITPDLAVGHGGIDNSVLTDAQALRGARRVNLGQEGGRCRPVLAALQHPNAPHKDGPIISTG